MVDGGIWQAAATDTNLGKLVIGLFISDIRYKFKILECSTYKFKYINVIFQKLWYIIKKNWGTP